jgi:hypothetical protein
MRKILLIIVGLITAVAAVVAQTPAPEPDTLRDPVKQTDPEPKTLPPNSHYIDDAVKITPQQIPTAVKQTLESGTSYTGWEKASLYKNKSGTVFIIEITKGDTTRTFHFDKLGRPVKE